MHKPKGLLIVFSGPSGSGKGTVLAEAMRQNKDLEISVSATTRAPRVGEVDGVNYFFKSKEAFQEMIAQEGFIEWAQFCENYYGTPRSYVESRLQQGKDVVLEIEVQGAMQVKKAFPDSVLIFNLPPSAEELRARLIGRQTESMEVVDQRLSAAKQELAAAKDYDYVIVNDEVAQAAKKFLSIVESEKLKAGRNHALLQAFQ